MQLVFSEKATHKRGTKLLAAAMAAMILLSYSFVIQPQGFPPSEEGLIRVDQYNAYVVLTKAGSYDLYVNGEYFHTLTEGEISFLPGSELEIRKEG